MRDDIPCKLIKLQYNLPPDIESCRNQFAQKKNLLVGGGGVHSA